VRWVIYPALIAMADCSLCSCTR